MRRRGRRGNSWAFQERRFSAISRSPFLDYFRIADHSPRIAGWLRTDASCLLGIVTIGCDVGREFTAEREIQNSGDPLTITLTMKVDSKSLTTFFRNQGVYLFIAFVIGAIYWAMGEPIHPF